MIVVRGQDDVVRVLSRVCRHRYVDLLGGKTSPDKRARGCAEWFECPLPLMDLPAGRIAAQRTRNARTSRFRSS